MLLVLTVEAASLTEPGQPAQGRLQARGDVVGASAAPEAGRDERASETEDRGGVQEEAGGVAQT